MGTETNLRNSTWRVVLWSLLDSGNNAPFIFMMMFFLVFNNESYGIAAGIVGAMMGISRIFDAITDPIIGKTIDKMHTKFGKYRPSLVIGSILLNVTLVLMFWGIEFNSEVIKIIFMSILYIVHIIGYTFVTATWKSGNTIITRDPKQRSMQGMYMAIGTMVIAILIMAGTQPFMSSMGGYQSPEGWKILGIVIAIVNIFFVLLAIIAIGNRDNENHYTINTKEIKFKDYLPILKENKPLSMLIVAASTNKLAATTMTTLTVYWYLIVMNNEGLQSRMAMITLPVTIIAAIAASIVAVKKSKRFTMIFGSWTSVVVIIALIIIRPFEPSQLVLYIAIFSLMSAFNQIANAQINVMIADTADYELWKTGKEIPGMISTTFSFIDKMVSSLSGFFVGGVIGFFGYTQGIEVSSALYWSVIALFLGVPLFGHLASIWAMKRYELDRELNLKIANDLKERKQGVK